MITRDQFVKYTRDALRQLYDPGHLIQSPLVQLCGLTDRPDAYTRLQGIVIEAIESLKPDDQNARHTSRETFTLLFNRYVQQLNQKTVAEQLGMSVRHLRRREYAAIEVLASNLWSQVDPELVAAFSKQRQEPASTQVEESRAILGNELAWLESLPDTSATANLIEILTSVVDFTRNLAGQYNVALEIQIDPGLPSVAVHPVVLDQIMVNLLTGALYHLAAGHITVTTHVNTHQVIVNIQGVCSQRECSLEAFELQAPLEAAKKLCQLCDVSLDVLVEQGKFQAKMHLPRTDEITILVIDDNPDTLQLFKRYAATTPYKLIITQDPLGAMELAVEVPVQGIILDVMMPQVDGWRMLSQFRQRPETAHIPVVICTILPQRELALSLGAADFLPKPVSREVFLETLDRVVGSREPTPPQS